MYSAMNDLPVGTPEQAGLFATGKANFQQNMQDPAKNKIMQALMAQSLSKIGSGLFGAQPLGTTTPSRAPRFDAYGNIVG